MSRNTPGCVELLLIRNHPPCRRCRKTAALLRELAQARPQQVTARIIRADDTEAARYGALLTPMVVVNGKVACAGMVPVKAGLEKLVDAELTGR